MIYWAQEELVREGTIEYFEKNMLSTITRFISTESSVLKEEEGEGHGVGLFEHRGRYKFYTTDHAYHISVVERAQDDQGYLGCTCSNRKPQAGESHTRGRDLADGKLKMETWVRIMGDIISNAVSYTHLRAHEDS